MVSRRNAAPTATARCATEPDGQTPATYAQQLVAKAAAIRAVPDRHLLKAGGRRRKRWRALHSCPENDVGRNRAVGELENAVVARVRVAGILDIGLVDCPFGEVVRVSAQTAGVSGKNIGVAITLLQDEPHSIVSVIEFVQGCQDRLVGGDRSKVPEIDLEAGVSVQSLRGELEVKGDRADVGLGAGNRRRVFRQGRQCSARLIANPRKVAADQERIVLQQQCAYKIVGGRIPGRVKNGIRCTELCQAWPVRTADIRKISAEDNVIAVLHY